MSENQTENAPPIDPNQKRKTESLLPRIYRTDSNKKFIGGTIDQLVQTGTVKRLNGFIGRQNAKSVTSNDVFLEELLDERQNYQLEPSLVIEDTLGNVTFFKDYLDYVHSVNVLGGLASNHQVLNQQEFYSWEPHIDWDKIVNFLHYYWLPFGPKTITIYGQQQEITRTFKVTLSDEGDNRAYLFTPNGLTRNPSLTLYRGQTYKFEIDTPGEPFSIKTELEPGSFFRYTDVDNFAVENGTITFTVPLQSPDVLYYTSEISADTSGIIKIFDIKENTAIDVENEIINAKTYTLPSGISLSNGMKVNFKGRVTPSSYSEGDFYVEGVGERIQLIPEKQLEIVAPYTTNYDVTFDDTGFDDLPYNDVIYSAADKDYITINRASLDCNPWTRYNRWFHQDVIQQTADHFEVPAVFDQSQRAKRPIIEFNANIKLYNFGIRPKKDVDLVDDFTNDVFSVIEGALSYNIDGVSLLDGHRILFTGDKDPLVSNKIFKVEFILIHADANDPGQRRIHLVQEPDSDPLLEEIVLIKNGVQYKSKHLWFNGSNWLVGQSKTDQNQPPLFDLFDKDQVSLSDSTKYEGTTFLGNKLFSYKTGSGVVDSELGFALSYKNINNVGDIVFNYNLLQESFSYKQQASIITENTDNKFLKNFSNLGSKYINGWTKNTLKNIQPIVRIYKNETVEEFVNGIKTKVVLVNNFPIDVYNDITDLNDLLVKVYINGKRIDKSLFSVEDAANYKKVVLITDANTTDIVTLRCYARQNKNNNGYYEFPINLQNNPLNNNINDFTLGEVIDHVDSIIDNLDNFQGEYPGVNNLRDIGNLSSHGTKFIQHSGSLNLALYHLTNKDANIITALEKARDDFGVFKRNFINHTGVLNSEITVKQAVDLILFEINQGKPKKASYYFSDMLAYGAAKQTDFTVQDYRVKKYPLATVFTLQSLSNKSVNVYVNNVQLLHEKDYIFGLDGFVEILCSIKEDDVITVYEYESTDGCYIPSTPTSLGLYPKFEPKIYLDTTLLEPQNVIQGHDGSIVLAFNDYRDQIILELEKRFFNNIKVKYDPNIIDIYDFIPNSNRPTEYTIDEFNQILAPNFYQWTGLIDKDFTKSLKYDSNNPFTYNYREAVGIDGNNVPGFWRGIYKWYFDTDRIHLTPWESLGFSIQPKWWESTYGPAPYTSNNLILWQDLRDGVIKEPGKPLTRNPKFARPVLKNIPVKEDGRLLDPLTANLAHGIFNSNRSFTYVFGDQSPVETAWRRSSYYPFSLLITMILMQPGRVLGCYLDRSRIVKNRNDQLIYSETGVRLRLKDLLTPNTVSDNVRTLTAGLVNYVVDYLQGDNSTALDTYKNDLITINNKLAHRLSAFTSKEKYNLILDSKSSAAKSGVFVPSENYKIFLNTSSPIKKILYSGVIVTKVLTKTGIGYEIKGYSQSNPYFYYYVWTQSGHGINVGGISESFIKWTNNQQYVVGNIIEINNVFYRVKTSHVSEENPSLDLLQKLPSLPIIGGATALIRKKWERIPVLLNYGTTLGSIQEVVDFLQGYGEYLKDQGLAFDQYNITLKSVASWETSVKEFLFWTTQNWSPGTENYSEWDFGIFYKAGSVVLYNGDYYKSKRDHTTTTFFDVNLYVKLDGLNQDGASAISLSPAALGIDLNLNYATVADLREQIGTYEIFSANGQKYDPKLLSYSRYDNLFSLKPTNENTGIYGASLYLIQKEHVLIIDNDTQFNDVIYSPETGYRQERIKVSGYKTLNWNGSLDAPGFIYDRAYINDWQPWMDYHLGDIVKYKEFYYSAMEFLPGQEEFNKNKWIRLDSKPTSQLLPNWDYKALQFTDFYDLDSDNFDVGQQKIAQHLIGYQKRQYLSNIIKNDVSEFKFYQGMIQEKGTVNSLNKLFDVLSADDRDSIDFIEEWAIRAGQYGASDAFDEVEFILDESQFKINPQAIELVSTVDNTLVDFVIRQTKKDIYLTPKFYQNNLWPVNSNYKPFLRTPGFVKYDQIKLAVDSKSSLLAEDIENFSSGDYIWCAFENKINEFNDDWNVYRFTKTDYVVDGMSYTDNTLFISFANDIDFTVGQIIGIKSDYDKVNSFFEISEIDGRIVTVNIRLINWKTPDSETLSTTKIFKILPQRFNTIDDIVVPHYLKKGELVWINRSLGNKYAVWQNNPVYTRTKLYDPLLGNEYKFGRKLVTNAAGDIMVVALGQNQSQRVNIYTPWSNDSGWSDRQTILMPGDIRTFAKTLAVSDDKKWLAIGCVTTSNNGVIELYQLNDSLQYEFVTTLTNSDPDPYFGFKIKFAYDGLYSLTISSTDGNSISGIIYYFKNFSDSSTWQFVTSIRPTDVDCENQPFAYEFDIDQTASTLALSTSLTHNGQGKVLVFHRNNETFTKEHEITKANQLNFGQTISLSNNGTYLAVSSQTNSKQIVNVYKNYNLFQTLVERNNDRDSNEKFGTYLKFVNNEKTLLIFSRLSDGSKNDLFNYDDSTMNYHDSITHHDDSTYIIKRDSGRADIYDIYDNKFIFSESLAVVSSQAEEYGSCVDVSDNTVIISAPSGLNDNKNSGAIYTHKRTPNNYSWKISQEETAKIDLSVFKKIFLYNKRTNQLVTYLDIIDPTQGKISGIAEQQIKYKTYYDPATYSFRSAASDISVIVDDGMSWLDVEVGTLWWDLSRAKFLDAHLSDIVYKNTTWNTLYETASIDVYEWVSSRYLPSAWDKLADTDQGITQGISGKSLYGDDVYSIKRTYDTVAKSFNSTYYFWVKNKTTIPTVIGRTNSAADISNIISNPKGAALKYIEFTDRNSFSLTNVKDLLSDRDVVLAIQYWNIPQHEINIHSQWKIISENEKTEIPKHIEKKWIDSLVGFDENGKMAPDLKLPPKQRYGIESKPRQSMFVNRLEAVKQVIERINSEFKTIQIDNLDLTDLLKKDLAPTTLSGVYDYVVDTESELQFINTRLFKKPELSLVIVNGSIVSINIDSNGYGYGTLQQIKQNVYKGPTISIIGKGINASIDVTVNSVGALLPIEIKNSGKGYDKETTTLSVRPLCALVRSDSTIFGNWAIYAYDPVGEIWSKIKIQEYDVTAFWNYIDWYGSYIDSDTGREYTYNQYSKIDHVVDGTYQLFTQDSEIGQTVKVNNVGSSGWMLLVKYANADSIDYTQSYKVVGRQNGSIQLSTNFYNFVKNKLGYDSGLYDSNKFDNAGTTELRIILNSLKDRILIDDRRILYLNLFFLSIRYALYEQPYLDWIFKTSFIKALHNVGKLKQKVTYSNDNLEDFESYISEVKPYRTKIREFVSVYNSMDNTQSMVTDFDLPSYITNSNIEVITTQIKNDELYYYDDIINEYPWKLWRDNIGFGIKTITISNEGHGYTSRPLVKIIGNCTRPAKARAFISNGQVIDIEILDTGAGYLKAPEIVIEGHLSVGGTQAQAVAIVKNDLVRSNLIAMKFDRYNKKLLSEILPLEQIDTFTGDNATITFNLKYSPNTESKKLLVEYTIDGITIDEISENYTIVKTSSKEKGHTVYYGQITFVHPPRLGTIITITYEKDFHHLSALDRIKHYYSPESGMIGKDFAQLMTGIDYGGVSIVGINFNQPLAWDSENNTWGDKGWDLIGNENKIYDTLVEGGNMAYTTATGLTAEDIIVDGDRFISPITSPAPEEMLPGHVVDTLVIKVFDDNRSGSSNVICDNYLTDGVISEFKVGQYPNSKSAVVVKLDQIILQIDVDYTIDFDNLLVKFNEIPEANKYVSIISIGLNGVNVSDTNHVIVETVTNEIITDYPWKDNISLLVLVSGVVQNYNLFKIDNKVGIRFAFDVMPGQLINYLIFDTPNKTTSIVSKETITYKESASRYTLSNPIGNLLPLEYNAIVKVGNEILNSVDSFYFILKNQVYEYIIPLGKDDINQYESTDFKVYVDNQLIYLSDGFDLDLLKSKIIVKSNKYIENAKLLVTIVKNAEYTIGVENRVNYIEFKNSYPENTKIEIISMFNHDILDIQRTDYQIYPDVDRYQDSIYYANAVKVSAGIFTLERPIADANYAWVIKNKTLLTPNIDYILSDNKTEIIVNSSPLESDKFSILTFSNNIVRDSIAFMQIKDMLNRTHYKRISKNRTTILAEDLHYYDKQITVDDGTALNEPVIEANAPGVIYVNGERIEYFIKNGNVLSQLRRGTWGTGITDVHKKSEKVLDIGPNESIPYKDREEVITWPPEEYPDALLDSTHLIELPFIPTKDSIEVFVGGVRQRKDAYTLHDPIEHPESPEGDIDYPADFAVDGINSQVRLEHIPDTPGIRIQVVRKVLTPWNDLGKNLAESTNEVAYFLKTTPRKLDNG